MLPSVEMLRTRGLELAHKEFLAEFQESFEAAVASLVKRGSVKEASGQHPVLHRDEVKGQTTQHLISSEQGSFLEERRVHCFFIEVDDEEVVRHQYEHVVHSVFSRLIGHVPAREEERVDTDFVRRGEDCEVRVIHDPGGVGRTKKFMGHDWADAVYHDIIESREDGPAVHAYRSLLEARELLE
jgi:hypothetical protein